MFQVTIPQELRVLIYRHSQVWKCSDIYIGCSGNFTIERTLVSEGFSLHGNDVQIYSCMLGTYFSGGTPEITLNPEYEEKLGWLGEYMKKPEDKIATLLICSNMLSGLDKENPYYNRMYDAHKQQFPALHEKTRDKIAGTELKLASFYRGDVFDYMDTVPQEQGFVSFPPFYAGGYETMFKNLEKAFLWNPPEYTEFDDDRMAALVDKIISKKYWLFGTRFVQEELSEFLCGKIKTTNRAMPFFVYSNSTKKILIEPRQKSKPCEIPRLGEHEEIGSRLGLTVINPDEFNSLRSAYLNANISPAMPSMGVGVLVDGKLIGAFAFSTAPTFTSWEHHIQTPTVYLMTDFAIRPTKYKRLSKLVLYALLSKEAKLLAERCAGRRQNSVVSTAFTNNPISMKYRGLFRLLTKKDAESSSFKYKLNYGAILGQWTLDEAFTEWKRKYAKK